MRYAPPPHSSAWPRPVGGGTVADIGAIAEAARRHDARLFVDTTQSNGCSRTTPRWPTTPSAASTSGSATAVRPSSPYGRSCTTPGPVECRVVRRRRPWSSIYLQELIVADDARRFDVSPAWLSWVGAVPALELLTDVGVEAVHGHNLMLANAFRSGLGMPDGDSAIVPVRRPDAQWRLEAAGCRGGGAVLSCTRRVHLWNTVDDVDIALRTLWTSDGAHLTPGYPLAV